MRKVELVEKSAYTVIFGHFSFAFSCFLSLNSIVISYHFLVLASWDSIVNDYFKFYENGGKFPKRVENTAVKREIARYKQFLHFSHVFERLFLRTLSSRIILLF